jgi:hypothetical protein
MTVQVGKRYRYSINNYIIDIYFVIESFDGSKYIGRANEHWSETTWYFDSNGVQVGTERTPDCGTPNVRLILNDETLPPCQDIS